MELKEDQFITLTDNNEEIVCTVLMTFKSEETDKNYIIYTDQTKNENGELNYMASIYLPGKDLTDLEPIETEEEWEIIEEIIKKYKEGELNA